MKLENNCHTQTLPEMANFWLQVFHEAAEAALPRTFSPLFLQVDLKPVFLELQIFWRL